MQLTRSLLSAVSTVWLTVAPAMAEDSAYDWSGLYIAAHLSGDSADISGRFQDSSGGLQLPTGLDNVTGASYGVSAGYNFQMSRFVLGIEGSYSGSSIEDTEKISFGKYRQTREIQDMIKVGPRAGVGLGHWHVFATAGLASSGVTVATQKVGVLTGAESNIQRSEDQVFGQYIGAGVEFALGKNIILGAQYDRTNLSGVSSSWKDVAGERLTFTSDDPVVDSITFKAGIKF